MVQHPFDYIEEQTKSLTITEAAASLNLAKSTVYKLALSGELRRVPTFDRRILIDETSIADYKAEHDTTVYMSLNKLVHELNISRVRLQQLIVDYQLHIPKIKHGKREQYAITEELKQNIRQLLEMENVYPKTTIFNRSQGILLHQAFSSRLNNQIYRIQRSESGIWGVQMPHEFVPYEVAKASLQLLPRYAIVVKRRSSPLKVSFALPLHDAHFFTVYDFIIQLCGIYNFTHRQVEDVWYLDVTQGKYPHHNLLSADDLNLVKQYLVQGQITMSESTIDLESDDMLLPIKLSAIEHEHLINKAAAKGLSVESFIHQVLQNAIHSK